MCPIFLYSLSKSGLSGLSQGDTELPFFSFPFFWGKAYIAVLVEMKCAHEVFSNVNIAVGTGAWITSQMWHLWDLVNKVLFISAGRILKFSQNSLKCYSGFVSEA